jgi:hypothetical protein
VNVVVDGTLAMVYVPLYPATPTPAMVTLWPVRKPCAPVVVIVTVDPDSVAPLGDAAIWLTNSNALLIDGGAITMGVKVTIAVEAVEVIAGPVGGVPPAVAESLTDPFVKSGCVMV